MFPALAGDLGSRRRCAALFTLSCVAYLPSLSGAFLLDDPFYIVFNEALRHPGQWLRFFHDADSLSADPGLSRLIYRPLLGFSHGLNHVLFGSEAFWFHLHDVILHGANTCLVFLLARRLCGKGNWRAWAAALLFCLHPVQAQSVAYVGSRAGLLSLFFLQVSLLAYASFPEDRRLSWAAFAAAAFCKESSLFFLAALPAYDVVYGPVKEPWKARVQRWLPYWAIGGVFLLARTAVLGGVSQREPWGGSWGVHGQLAAHAMFQYVRLTVWPAGLREPYGFLLGPHFLSQAWLMAGAVAALSAASLYGLSRRASWGFALFWYFAALAPVSNLVPFGSLMADRYLYASMLGLGLLLGGLLPERPSRPAAAAALAAALLLGLANIEQQLHWRSGFVLALEACEAAPAEPYAAMRLATNYSTWRMFDRAEALLRLSLGAEVPVDVRRTGYKRLGQLRLRQGRPRDAIAFLEASLAMDPRQKSVLELLAQARRAR
ncbi:MAG: hypothetical protein AAB320_11030 [Elusimicrobiota bacterium]